MLRRRLRFRTAHSDAAPLGALSGPFPKMRWLTPGNSAGRETIFWSCQRCDACLAGPEGAPRNLLQARRRQRLLRGHA
eukprot:6717706-Alexandrium_andersonii.AAC.1